MHHFCLFYAAIRIYIVLDIELKELRHQALRIFNAIYDETGELGYYCDEKDYTKNLQMMHGLIGGKNNILTDVVRTQFVDFDDFICTWMKNLNEQNDSNIENNYAPSKLFLLMKDDMFREYAMKFLERNFYRNLDARMRAKPNERLWELWFGENNYVLGLLITPVLRQDRWSNDVSEIRHVNYMYWTTGHVMNTGFVNPDEKEKINVDTPEKLFEYYRHVLKKLAVSEYEKEIYEKYINYLRNSNNINEEPLLIPEIRYAGLEKKHEHRLDFAVLNSHTQEYIGFELSPASSHMSVSGIKKGKTQAEMNTQLEEKWYSEMNKRNKYFSEYGITTITFTDQHIENMDNVFSIIKKYLENRRANKTTLQDEVNRLKSAR